MPEFKVEYRGGEVSAIVRANNEEEARRKFAEGKDVKKVEVGFGMLHLDFIECVQEFYFSRK